MAVTPSAKGGGELSFSIATCRQGRHDVYVTPYFYWNNCKFTVSLPFCFVIVGEANEIEECSNFNERRTDRNQLMSITLFTGDSRESGEIQSGQKPNEDR